MMSGYCTLGVGDRAVPVHDHSSVLPGSQFRFCQAGHSFEHLPHTTTASFLALGIDGLAQLRYTYSVERSGG